MANTLLYGFHTLEGMADQRVTEIGVDVVSRAIDAAVAEHNRQMQAILGLFAQRTTEFKIRYKTATAARLQGLTDDGRALPIQPAGFYDVAFPLQQAGTAWGATYRASQKMTVQEANDITNTLLNADLRWMRDHVLAALFASASWNFADELHGTLTIKGPANGDTDQYLILAGADTGTTDDHILAQADAVADATDPTDTMIEELVEHPENDGDVVILVPTANKSAYQGLAKFHPVADPNVRRGANTDVLVGDLGVEVPGEIFGYHDDGAWLAEWRSLPSNYLIGLTTGGEAPLALREEEESTLQGFNRVAERNDHPFYESQYLRIAGFGAWNRVGVVIQQVGNGTYAVPTNYSSPMA